MLRTIEDGVEIYRRAAELGVNYFDGRYGYSTTMQRPVIATDRAHFVVGSKTASTTYNDVLHRIDEDLEVLGTDYLDIYYLRTYNQELLDTHFAPGGSLEGLIEAKKKGKIRAIALAGHSDLSALARGVESGLIDVVEFPLNIVRRDAYDVLIPACLKHDVGMVIMKPVNVGLAPAEISLPWLANQPIHTMPAGISTLEHLEADVACLDRHPMALTPDEEAEVERWRQKTEPQSCRICDKKCQVVCEPGINIDWQIYHNIFQNELRRLGTRGFLEYPFAPWIKEQAEATFANTVTSLQTCTRCGKCEEVCPYHLPVMELVENIKVQQTELLDALRSLSWDTDYKGSDSPLSPKVLASWISGGKKK